MKRYISLLLALLLMVGLLAGCNSTEEDDPSGTPDTTTTEPTPDGGTEPTPDEPTEFQLPLTEEGITLDYWIPSDNVTCEGYSSRNDSVFYKWMEDQTGVHINFMIPPAGGEKENFQTMILSNDYPDMIGFVQRYYDGGMDKAINDNVLLPLNDLAEQYMPNYMKVVNRDSDTFMQCVSDSGNLWGVHCILDRPQGSWIGTAIRGDWLADAGMTIDDVSTVDGLESALTAFKDYTTDGAGPLFISSGSAFYSGSITGSWNVIGVSYMPFLNKDGTCVYNALEPGYRDYVEKMADWYAKGLVNKNYVAENGWKVPDTYWANADAGCGDEMYASLSTLKTANAASETAYDPDFEVIAIPTPKLNASDDIWNDYHVRESFNVVRVNNSTGITTACENIEIACKYWDYVFTDEGTIASNWGPYGGELGDRSTSYYIDPNDANGDGHVEAYQPWLMEEIGNITYFMGKYTIHNGPQLYIWDREFTSLTEKEVTAAKTWDSVGSDWLWPDGVTLTADEGAEGSTILTSCNTAVTEWAAKVITGEKDISTYDTELVPTLKGMNIDRAIELYQGALSRYYDRAQFMD